MKCFVAPLQGFTDDLFRRAYADIFGTPDRFFTPFIRVERGQLRVRDVRGVTSELNQGLNVVPQIIFRDTDEFDMLISRLKETGADHIDINMACPFPPQVHKGRGAGMLLRPEFLETLKGRLSELEDMKFSVKMRLGVDDPADYRHIMGIINDMQLEHVTIHPRIASQQYAGETDMDEFSRFLDSCRHPVIYNGDITEPSQIDSIAGRYPGIAGVMAGRGLIARPSLFTEWNEGAEWDEEKRATQLLKLHDALMSGALERLSGDRQILAHLQPYWEYFGRNFERRQVKALLKARTVEKYIQALGNLR